MLSPYLMSQVVQLITECKNVFSVRRQPKSWSTKLYFAYNRSLPQRGHKVRWTLAWFCVLMVLWGVDPVARVMWHLQSWQTVILWNRIFVSLIAQGKNVGLASERNNTWSSGVPLGKNVWNGDEVQRPCHGRCVEICEYSSLLALSHLYMCIIFSDHGELPTGNNDS